MFMEQSHNKQVESVDIFPTQCSSSIGSNGVIIVSFTVRNDSLMRVMLFIQHTVTGGPGVNKIFRLKMLRTAYSVYTLFSRHDWQKWLNIEVIVNHRSTSIQKRQMTDGDRADNRNYNDSNYLDDNDDDDYLQCFQLAPSWHEWLFAWEDKQFVQSFLITSPLCHDTSRTTRMMMTMFDFV